VRVAASNEEEVGVEGGEGVGVVEGDLSILMRGRGNGPLPRGFVVNGGTTGGGALVGLMLPGGPG